MRPESKSLDWAASVAHGWDPDSDDEALYSFGNLTTDFLQYRSIFENLAKSVLNSRYSYLLDPITGIEEPTFFPDVTNPVDEEMVAIDPSIQIETGLHPKAALWQSGWENSHPYIVVRSQVKDRLAKVVQTLKKFNPEFYLCITDGWRSIEQQRDLYNAFYPNGHNRGEPLYVSPPESDDRFAVPHPSGGAVDVMIGYRDKVLSIGSDLDHMDVEANTVHFEDLEKADPLIRDMRRFFSNLLADSGFISIDSEWWHVEYGTRRWAAKKNTNPLYGNAVVDRSHYLGVDPVAPVIGSKRSALQTSDQTITSL